MEEILEEETVLSSSLSPFAKGGAEGGGIFGGEPLAEKDLEKPEQNS